MLTAVAQRQGNNIDYLQAYSGLLDIWRNFLNSSLPDPGDQLCTDDFEGPSPHNVNLAAKGVIGYGALGLLQAMAGNVSEAKVIAKQAELFAGDWLRMANDTDHYRLQYNLPNTWSMKYNILFQYILRLELFPDTVMQQELAYYQTKRQVYGVPLDDRALFTKTDWESWVGAMGTSQQFADTVAAIYKFADETPSRVPFSDWYFTDTGIVKGFRARPVIGGLYARAVLQQGSLVL